jgi:hypothetical protein
VDPAFRSLAACNWGTGSPANGPSSAPLPYQLWCDTTTNPVVVKMYDGGSWVVVGKLNTSSHAWTPSYQGTDMGTASTATTGTSGHVLGFLDSINTISALWTFSSGDLAAVSPAFTGSPTAPTAAVDTNTTQIASAAFVIGQAASATPLIDGSAAVGTSTRFARGDHVHPTDTTRVPTTRNISTGCGFTGGGDLSADRTLKLNLTINPQVGTSYTVVDGDCGKLVTFNNASPVAVTLPQANGSTFVSGWSVDYQNKGAGAVTITPITSTINGGSSLTLSQNQGMHCDSDGTNYSCVLGVGPGGGSGTVTQVVCGAGLAGGTITASGTCAVSLTTASNILGSDVSLNNLSSYFDGPSMAQGIIGAWFASGGVTLLDTGGNGQFNCKLWDGTTVIASKRQFSTTSSQSYTIHLSGILANPTANARISCNDPANTTGKIQFNASGNSKDSFIYGFRIQ